MFYEILSITYFIVVIEYVFLKFSVTSIRFVLTHLQNEFIPDENCPSHLTYILCKPANVYKIYLESV